MLCWTHGGDDENIRRILTDDVLRKKLAQLIVEAGKTTISAYRVTINCNQSPIEMIRAGRYDRVNDDITAEFFQTQGKGREERDIVLFYFKRTMTSKRAISNMDKAGFRPATFPELLALGAEHKELQRQFPIVALGHRPVPYLHQSDNRCCLSKRRFENEWRVCYRFAAVRK